MLFPDTPHASPKDEQRQGEAAFGHNLEATMFFCCFLAVCQPTIKIPSEITGKPGQFIEVKAETDGKVVRYFTFDQGLNIFPSALLSDKKATVCTATVPGKYRLLAYTAIGDNPSDPVMVTINIVGDVPAPVPPPVPPAPVPPAPTDPFTNAIQAIYGALQEPDASKNKDILADVYRQAATLAQDGRLRTIGELYLMIRQGSKKVLPESALITVRERISQELSSQLPIKADTELTPVIRGDCERMFSRVAAVLEAVK